MSPIPLLSFPNIQIKTNGEQLLKAPEKLEEWLHNYYKNPVILCNSGSAALHLATLLLELKKRDEILCQDSSFIASCHPILYQNATPVFIDIESKTKQLDWSLVEEYQNKRPLKNEKIKALIFANNYGYPSTNNTNLLLDNIPTIEDNAAGFGSLINNKPTGLSADYSILSFNNNKIISGYGGGALILKTEEDYHKANSIIQHGRNLENGHLHNKTGYNYRISPIQAHTILEEIKHLDQYLNIKKEIHYNYKSLFKDTGLCTFPNNEKTTPNHWLNVFWHNNQHINKTDNFPFETRKPWFPLHLQDHLKQYAYLGKENSLDFHNRGICLPSGINLSHEDQQKIVQTVLKSLKN